MQSNLLNRIKKLSEDTNQDEVYLISEIRKVLDQYVASNETLWQSKSISELIQLNLKTMNSDTKRAISTGWENYDDFLGGLVPGEFVVIGSRPGMGKTQLLINLALNLSVRVPVLYVSLDMSEYNLSCRITSSMLSVSYCNLVTGKLKSDELKKIEHLPTIMSAHNLHIVDRPSNSIEGFKKLCEEQIQKNGIQVIIVDYLQLLSMNRFRYNRDMEIGLISRMLKTLARENNICLIVSSQLSRSVEQRGGDKRPILSDLRESGSIEQDSDKVIFMYRPEYYGFLMDENGISTIGMAELIVAKNRSGTLGSIKMNCDLGFSKFEPYKESITQFSIYQSRLDELKPPF